MHTLTDLFTDFLIRCPGQCSATMMSEVTDGLVSHDKVTRLLASQKTDSRALWKMVKPMCHEVKDNRRLALSLEDKKAGRYRPITETAPEWKVEQYHTSLKQIGGLDQRPSWKFPTQCSHLSASVMAFAKPEPYKERHGKNHFAIRATMLKNAASAAWRILDRLAGKRAA